MIALTVDLSTTVAAIRTGRIWFIWNFIIVYEEKGAKQVCGGWGLDRLYCRTLKKWDHEDWSEMQWLQHGVEVHFMTSWRYILFTELQCLSNRDHYGTITCEANKAWLYRFLYRDMNVCCPARSTKTHMYHVAQKLILESWSQLQISDTVWFKMFEFPMWIPVASFSRRSLMSLTARLLYLNM